MAAPSYNPPPIRQPLLDKGGFLSTPWLQWFRSLYVQTGGSDSDPLSDVIGMTIVNAAVAENVANLQADIDGLAQVPVCCDASSTHEVDRLQILTEAPLPTQTIVDDQNQNPPNAFVAQEPEVSPLTPEIIAQDYIDGLVAELQAKITDLQTQIDGLNQGAVL